MVTVMKLKSKKKKNKKFPLRTDENIKETDKQSKSTNYS